MKKSATLTSMWIGGELVESSSKKLIEVEDPATQEIVGSVPDGIVEDARKAISAAREAFPDWRKVPGVKKAEYLHGIARALREHASPLAETLTHEGGKPLRENLDEMEWSAASFDYYAEIGRNFQGRVISPIEPSQISLVVKEPLGVVSCIAPWNYPILLMAWKVAPAIAAGNTVVIKPSSLTPLSTLALSAVFRDLPRGVVNIVTGRGITLGDELVAHPDVQMVAFTGSVETGKRIASLAAAGMKKVHLELGGKDPFVVCEDADLDVASKAAAWAAFLNTGQVCTSTERIYLQKKIRKEFTERLVEFVKSLRLGHGMEPTTDIGPMIGESYRKKVEDHIQEAVSKGARVLSGGKRPSDFPRGYFFEPTVLDQVTHSMKIMQEETFGPVAPIMEFSTFDEAIRLCNDTVYGLGSILYTHDAKRVKQFMEEVQAGTVWINDPLTDNDAAPFGGMKMTGHGRELGEEGIEAFRETKHVHWDFEQNLKPWWYPY